jgi:hypothetical protein
MLQLKLRKPFEINAYQSKISVQRDIRENCHRKGTMLEVIESEAEVTGRRSSPVRIFSALRLSKILSYGGADNAGDRGYGLPFPISISYLHQSRSHEVTTVSA